MAFVTAIEMFLVLLFAHLFLTPIALFLCWSVAWATGIFFLSDQHPLNHWLQSYSETFKTSFQQGDRARFLKRTLTEVATVTFTFVLIAFFTSKKVALLPTLLLLLITVVTTTLLYVGTLKVVYTLRTVESADERQGKLDRVVWFVVAVVVFQPLLFIAMFAYFSELLPRVADSFFGEGFAYLLLFDHLYTVYLSCWVFQGYRYKAITWMLFGIGILTFLPLPFLIVLGGAGCCSKW